jgi:hypothetical protein
VAGVAVAIIFAVVITVWRVTSRNDDPPTAPTTSIRRSIDDSNKEVPAPSPPPLPPPAPVPATESESPRAGAGEEAPVPADVPGNRRSGGLDTSNRQAAPTTASPKHHKRDRGVPGPARHSVFDKTNPYR